MAEWQTRWTQNPLPERACGFDSRPGHAGAVGRAPVTRGDLWDSGPVFVTSHVLSGVAIGQATRGRPGTAFVWGLGSHLVLDAVPHWACSTVDDEGRAVFVRAAKRDGVLGLAAVAAALATVDRRDRIATIAAIAGAVLLDLDKPCKYFFGVNPFPRPIIRLHAKVQNEAPDGMPKEVGYGALFAVTDALLISRRRRSEGRAAARGPARDRRARGRLAG